jgi:hypothetical protein
MYTYTKVHLSKYIYVHLCGERTYIYAIPTTYRKHTSVNSKLKRKLIVYYDLIIKNKK